MSENIDKVPINPFDSHEPMKPLDEQWAARRRLANQQRRLIEASVTSNASVEDLNLATKKVAAVADLLEKSPQQYGRTEFLREHIGRGVIAYELGPLCGMSNAIAAPMFMHVDHEKGLLSAEVTLGWQYEGPPAAVHGGFVAAIFDDFLGMGQRLTGQSGVTGTITIKYRNLTPLNTKLVLKGWVDKIDGRKNFLKGEMWAGDTLTAECEGLFIHVDTSKYRAQIPKS